MLVDLVPGPLLRFFARPYVAGGTMAEALECAEALLAKQELLSTLDLLGEDVTSQAQVDGNHQAYLKLIESIAERFPAGSQRPTVSVKPSAFCVGPFQESSFEVIEDVIKQAKASDIACTIDMEDRRWTDVTIERSIDFFNRGFDVGTVLQTRLHRTEQDLSRIPSGMRIRLVIGIYPEPADVATTDKAVMKDRLVTYARTLLDAGARVEFATHDENTLRRFAQEVAPTAPGCCEVQMLLGVPRSAMQAELRDGSLNSTLPVRLYVPFAIGWADATAYLRRRMAESPNVILPVLRNMISRDR